MSVEQIKQELAQAADPQKAEFLPGFFQAYPGGYGQGDRFLGVSVPAQRKIAGKYYRHITLAETEELLQQPFHEERLTALFILVRKMERSPAAGQEEIVKIYLRNLDRVNNWDLVDSSADKILGSYLMDKDRQILYRLAGSGKLWEQRIAVIATFWFIRRNQFDDTFRLARLLLEHRHDLIHKAVGWMLREAGNRDREAELNFLYLHYRTMPRTMLRYAIEKFEPELRQQFLKGQI
jgi:3-methyladenine DNA glycosylase AlkD